MTKRSALEKLQACGIKPSVQRLAIMDYMLTHFTHPTVEEVYQALSPSITTLSRTTVYNTLRLFSEQGAIQMLTIDERKVCFDGCCEPHAHFWCRCCGQVFDLSAEDHHLAVLQPIPHTPHRVEEAHLYYKGVCADCAQAAENDTQATA